MPKAKANSRHKTSKPSVKVDDLVPKKEVKGGAFDAFAPATIKLADGSVVPNPAFNMNTYAGRK